MRHSITAELGGRDGVHAVVTDLYARLLSDPDVAPYFDGVDIGRLATHMTDFLVVALEGADRYQRSELQTAHAHLRITDDAFDTTASHLLDALADRGVRPGLLDSVLDRIAPLRAVVVDPGGDD